MEALRTVIGRDEQFIAGFGHLVFKTKESGIAGADNPEHLAKPLFVAPALNAAVILKHRLRANEIGTVSTRHRTATKLIVPFERSDLSLGGRSLFVGDRGWMESLQ